MTTFLHVYIFMFYLLDGAQLTDVRLLDAEHFHIGFSVVLYFAPQT